MNWKLSSTVGALTLMTATTLSNVSPANAAALVGTFNIGGAVDIEGADSDGNGAVDLIPGTVNGAAALVPATNFDFLELDNTPGGTTGEFAVLPGNTGTFTSFNFPQFGVIQDLDFPDEVVPDFLTFVSPSFNNSFTLTDVGLSSYLDIDQNGDGVDDGSTVSLGFNGQFISANGDISDARGTFSADFNILSAAVISALTTGDRTIENVSFSAQFVAVEREIPESSTTAGLVAFGLAGVVALARKRQGFSLK